LAGWKTRDMFDRYNIIDSAMYYALLLRGFHRMANTRHTKRWNTFKSPKLSCCYTTSAPVAQVDRAAVS
jgi:hypothetical protein